MAFQNPPDETIKSILATPQTVAVVGCSPNPERDSHRIAKLLQDRGHRVIPVNPGHRSILGENCYASLRDIPEAVDMVDIFRRSEHIPPLLEQLLEIRPPLVWMQQGIRHDEVARSLESAGIAVVMDRCLAVDHQFLGA